MRSQEPKKKRTKPTKRKTLVSNLDRYFSRFVRWSNADSDGNVKCATCDTKKHVKDMQILAQYYKDKVDELISKHS